VATAKKPPAARRPAAPKKPADPPPEIEKLPEPEESDLAARQAALEARHDELNAQEQELHEQAAAMPPPAVFAQHEPEHEEPATIQSAGNESPVLAASLQSAAVKAHGALAEADDHLGEPEPDLGYIRRLVRAVRDDLERYLPDHILALSEAEGGKLARHVRHSS